MNRINGNNLSASYIAITSGLKSEEVTKIYKINIWVIGGLDMIKQLNTRNDNTAKEIIDLQQQSYKIEADIIGFDGIPTLKDTIDTIKQSDEIFYGYYIENSLVGMISYKVEEHDLDICRVAVHPCYFRKGIAEQMIKFIESINSDIEKTIVSTGFKNQPAINLYLKLGFKKVCVSEIERGVHIISLEKQKSNT